MSTVLITGANRGIGFEAARQLKNNGFEVLLTARNKEKGEKAATELGVEFFPLDVSKEDSIQNLATQLNSKGITLDVLINNAGILPDKKSITEVSRKEIDAALQVNSMGPLFLVKALESIINDEGHIINVSSGAGSICDGHSNYAPLYCLTKSFLNIITMHLSDSLSKRGIKVNAVNPGWTQTDMGGDSAPGSVSEGAETIVWLAKGGAGNSTCKFYQDKEERSW